MCTSRAQLKPLAPTSRAVNDASPTSCHFVHGAASAVVAWRRACTLDRYPANSLGSPFRNSLFLALTRHIPLMSATIQIVDERKAGRGTGRAKGRPHISVVLVSDGCWQTVERSLARVAPRCRGMHAEVIAIRSGDEAVPVAIQSANPEVRFCFAPSGTTEAQLRTIAMLEASGDIVALRRAAEVEDAIWLDAHFRAATGTEPADFDEAERAVYDGVTEHVQLETPAADTTSRRSATPVMRHATEASPAGGATSAA